MDYLNTDNKNEKTWTNAKDSKSRRVLYAYIIKSWTTLRECFSLKIADVWRYEAVIISRISYMKPKKYTQENTELKQEFWWL